MNNRTNQNDIVATMAERAAGLQVPAPPNAQTNERLIAEMQRRSERPTAASFPEPRSTWSMQRVLSVAAILAFVAGVFVFSPSRNAGSGAVFAAMIERVNAIRNVSFNLKADLGGEDKTNIDSTFTVAYPWTRVAATVDGAKIVGILNADRQKELILIESVKTAQLRDAKGSSKMFAQSNVVDRLRNLRKEDAEYLGKEQIDGVELHKYRQQNKGDSYTIWINPVTQLPVQVESSDPAGTYNVRYFNFKWDEPLDMTQFTLEPPAGYKLSETTNP